MKNKLQILDGIHIFAGVILGIVTKILEQVTVGDIKTVFAAINICALVVFANGVINMIEDKYGVKIFNFKSTNKRIDYVK